MKHNLRNNVYLKNKRDFNATIDQLITVTLRSSQTR